MMEFGDVYKESQTTSIVILVYRCSFIQHWEIVIARGALSVR